MSPPTPDGTPVAMTWGWRRSTEDAVHWGVCAVLSLVLTLLACGTDVPIAAHRCIDALPSIPGVADRTGHVCQSRQGSMIGQLDCVAQSRLVGSGLGSRLIHILAPGGLTLRRGGSVWLFLSLRLGSSR